MAIGLLGTKLGMTQVFTDEGFAIPITVIKAGPCIVTQIKTLHTDGYNSVQLGYEVVSEKKLNKPKRGHLLKANINKPLRRLKEYRLDKVDNFEVGQLIQVDFFEKEQLVDITGATKGKGFSGCQKRHHFNRRWGSGEGVSRFIS